MNFITMMRKMGFHILTHFPLDGCEILLTFLTLFIALTKKTYISKFMGIYGGKITDFY